MQYKKLLKSAPHRNDRARILCLLLVAAFCFSCAPQVIKGRPPFITVSGMSLVNDRLSAEFDIRNENGIPMTIDRVNITMTVNDTVLAKKNSKFDLRIDANSVELVRVEELPDNFERSLLKSLESGEVKSLPFDLKGKVHTVEDGDLAFAHKGYLYPVPGKPGYFRSAVTRAQGLQREEKI